MVGNSRRVDARLGCIVGAAAQWRMTLRSNASILRIGVLPIRIMPARLTANTKMNFGKRTPKAIALLVRQSTPFAAKGIRAAIAKISDGGIEHINTALALSSTMQCLWSKMAVVPYVMLPLPNGRPLWITITRTV